MKIRQFEREDLQTLLAVQNKNPLASRWIDADYLRLATGPGGMILVAELETMTPPKLLGFAAFQRLIDEAELLNIAVDPEHQNQGVGRELLEEARKRLLKVGAKRIFLEVRRSNEAALSLYYSVGFGLRSLRKDYYRDPPDDAYVLSLELFTPEVVQARP
ncbi:MAG: ribosomal protein S18-alanine N-acetyltransferase [Terriglobia bacterium]|jgi:ribosomal-protein-alanine N-acetyltransferase